MALSVRRMERRAQSLGPEYLLPDCRSSKDYAIEIKQSVGAAFPARLARPPQADEGGQAAANYA